MSAEEAREEATEARESATEAKRAEKKQATLDASCEEAYIKLISNPLGCSPAMIRDPLGWSGGKTKKILWELVERGQAEQVWPVPDSAPKNTREWFRSK